MQTPSIRLPSLGVYSVAWLDAHPEETQRMLRDCHGQPARCLCRRPPPKLYIGHRDDTYYLARFPETGPAHAPQCASYTPDPMYCGRGAYAPGAITERTDGRVSVRLDAPLDSNPARGPGVQRRPREALTLAGLLHLLWDRARFAAWTPAMRGRRRYRQVRKFLLEAAAGVLAERRPLVERLWIPEPYVHADRHAINARRTKALMKLASPGRGGPRRVLVAGQLKALTNGDDGGAVLRLAHTPPYLLLGCGPGAADRLRRSAGVAWQEGAALRKDTHLFLLLTMERVNGAWAVARIAALPTDRHYLPVTSLRDLLLTEHLVDDGRYLFKPLAYDGSRDDYPTALLTDVGRRAVPLEISTGSDPISVRRRRVAACRDEDRLCWHWDSTRTPHLPVRSIPHPQRGWAGRQRPPRASSG